MIVFLHDISIAIFLAFFVILFLTIVCYAWYQIENLIRKNYPNLLDLIFLFFLFILFVYGGYNVYVEYGEKILKYFNESA